MLTPVDFGVMICFLALNVVTGWWSRSLVKDSGDFFRAGGRMSWWMVGISTFMASFSSWTFTGAAGIAYEHGVVVLGIYFANVLGFLLNAACFAP